MCKMKITILGSGTSTGVPEIGCRCEVCTSDDRRDRRLRTSILVETKMGRILIDAGPDFRQQIEPLPFRKIDGVLITHEHYDHVGGIDDLRPFCRFGEIPVFAEKEMADKLRTRLPYCFGVNKYPGVPNIVLQEIEPGKSFKAGGMEILPIRVMHGKLPILGFRIGKMAFLTDVLTIPEEAYMDLQGLDVLIINALRIKAHPTHQSLEEALAKAERIGARHTWFIHMSHHIGLHREVEQLLPEHIRLAYDGEVICV